MRSVMDKGIIQLEAVKTRTARTYAQGKITKEVMNEVIGKLDEVIDLLKEHEKLSEDKQQVS